MFWRHKRPQSDFSEELQTHLTLETDRLREEGMSEEQASAMARRNLGNITKAQERFYESHRWLWLDYLWQDLRYGLRQLRRSPGFTAVAVITLALGIGANTAIFSVINAALLHPLPFQNEERLVTRWGTISHFDYTGPIAICGRDYAAWRDQNNVFEGIGAFGGQTSNLTGAGEPVRLLGSQVTAGLFPLLGIAPALGRTFQSGEDTPGKNHVVVLSDTLWRSRFGGARTIVGKPITLDGELYTVVGVMPKGFDFPNESAFWTPVALTNECSNATMQLIAKLKPGVMLDQARAEVAVIDRRVDQKHDNSGNTVSLVPLGQAMGYDLRPELLVLLGAVGFLLLIACANVANLLLARGAARQHEMAIRNALGASRQRLLVQMLAESLLLAALGGALGLAVAACSHSFLASSFALLPSTLFSASIAARVSSLGTDGWVLGFTLAVTCLTGIITGLAPAFKISKPDLQNTLKESGRRNQSARRSRTRNVLVMGEIALSLVLLVGAGLLVRTLLSLMSVNPGFNPEGVLTMTVDLPESRYHTDSQMIAFEARALERLRALPGVRSVGGVFGLPLGALQIHGDITVEGQPNLPAGTIPAKVVVAGDYFRALRIPLIEGRFFTQGDSPGGSKVAIISAGLARRLWPHGSAIGKHLKPGFYHDSWYRIVGVVGNVKMSGLADESPLTLYLPYEQSPVPFLMQDLTLVVRTAMAPASIVTAARHAINSVDPELPVYGVATMEQLVYRSASGPRFDAALLGLFATLALVLASIGIYGVMSYSVSQRTQEIGIRMALGAQRSGVLRLVVGQGLKLTFIGVAIGIIGALGLTRFLSSLLYGVTPTDPLTFVVISLILLGIALLACYIPARRATKVDPMVALRHE